MRPPPRAHGFFSPLTRRAGSGWVAWPCARARPRLGTDPEVSKCEGEGGKIAETTGETARMSIGLTPNRRPRRHSPLRGALSPPVDGPVGGRSVRAEVAETGGEIGGKSELALVRSPALFEPTSPPPPLPFLSRLRDAQAFELLSRYLSQLLERRA